jgi:hypothetical protein
MYHVAAGAYGSLDVREQAFDPHFELCWSLDFNIDPASSILCQVVHDQVNVLDEISLRNSNTGAVCEEFARRAEKYLPKRTRFGPLDVRVYGDATGDSRKSNASRTDWQMVRDFFKRTSHLYRVHMDVSSSNPPVKDRVNCVNAVKDAGGTEGEGAGQLPARPLGARTGSSGGAGPSRR